MAQKIGVSFGPFYFTIRTYYFVSFLKVTVEVNRNEARAVLLRVLTKPLSDG